MQLMRLPNVFTAVADILMGFLFTHLTLEPVGQFVLLLAASSSLYVAGIVLNDVLPPGCQDPAVVSNRMELELRCVPPVVAQLGHDASDFDSPVNWLELARMSAIAE